MYTETQYLEVLKCGEGVHKNLFGNGEGSLNEQLAQGWNVIRFFTYECRSKNKGPSTTIVVAILGRSNVEQLKDTNVPITVLELGVRTENQLRAAGVNTVQKFVQLSEIDVLKIPNIGRKSFDKIKVALAQFGLTLR